MTFAEQYIVVAVSPRVPVHGQMALLHARCKINVDYKKGSPPREKGCGLYVMVDAGLTTL